VHLEEEVFRGYVENDLAVEIAAVRLGGGALGGHQDTFCKYKRLFNGPVQSLLGRYKPNDEPIDPEIVGTWEVWYRIERA
jgi:hypothetical protein